MGTVESLAYFLPELALTVGILAVIFVDLFAGREGRMPAWCPARTAMSFPPGSRAACG